MHIKVAWEHDFFKWCSCFLDFSSLESSFSPRMYNVLCSFVSEKNNQHHRTSNLFLPTIRTCTITVSEAILICFHWFQQSEIANRKLSPYCDQSAAVTIRSSILTDDGVGVEYMKYHSAGVTEDSDDTVQDGKNVRSIYRLIKDLSSISHLK